MASESSFDVVSKVDRQEVDNALNQAAKEVRQRFDFKNTDATIRWSGPAIEMEANSEERVKAVLDVFQTKLIKRGVSLKAVDAGEPRSSGNSTRSPRAPRKASRPRTPRRSPSSSATRVRGVSRPRSRATNSGSAARAATTCSAFRR